MIKIKIHIIISEKVFETRPFDRDEELELIILKYILPETQKRCLL